MTLRYTDPVSWEDHVLYLYLLAKLHEIEQPINKIQEQKLYFLTQFLAMQDGGILSRAPFQRWQYGPGTPHLYDLEREFEELGMIQVQSKRYISMEQAVITLTRAGLDMFDEISELFDAAPVARKYFDKIVSVVGKEKGWDLRLISYDLQVGGVKIRDLPLKAPIPTMPAVVLWKWSIPAEWQYTVEFLLGKGNLEHLKRISSENAAAPMTPWVPLK